MNSYQLYGEAIAKVRFWDRLLVLVGGAQFLEYAAVRFQDISLVDSMPFHKTMRRRNFDATNPSKPWNEVLTLYGQKLDSLLLENITEYAKWIEQRVQAARLAAHDN